MKRTLRLISAFLALCVAATLFPPVGLAADTNYFDLRAAVAAAKDGDTITLPKNADVSNSADTKGDIPWIINKRVEIVGNGYYVTIHTGGIVLDADVTFRDIELDFTSNVRNAIVANGHTLTLDSVTAGAGAHSINLFCGSLRPASYEAGQFTVPAPGTKGTIIIQGNTNLQPPKSDNIGPANIFAGSLCMGYMGATDTGTVSRTSTDEDGPATVFNGDAEIRIEGHGNPGGGVLPLGQIYAGGGQQRVPYGATAGKVTIPDPQKYTVSGTVTINGAKIPNVDGAGSTATNVEYTGDGTLFERTFANISSLSVESGSLVLKPASSFRKDKALSVSSGAKLNVADLAGSAIGNFTGEGYLILGQSQTLNIDGQVAGTTKVAIGGLNYDNTASTKTATVGHTYIQAPNSSDGNFVLLPYSTQPNMTLVRGSNGNWTASDGSTGGGIDLVVDFTFNIDSKTAKNGEEVVFPLTVDSKSDGPLYLDFIPLTIEVNGRTARRAEENIDGDTYYVYKDTYLPDMKISGNDFFVTSDAEWGYADSPYTIKITVPSTHTANKQNITKTATLTVTGSGTTPDPGPISIAVPTAVPNLKWTGAEQTGVKEGTGYTLTGRKGTNAGSYTATAALQDGYQWNDGTTTDKTIPWSIAKADGPAAPTGLLGTAPTSEGGTDGKITGTTAQMEYAADRNFTSPKDCGNGETGGLTAGTYYVRVKGTANQEPGAAALVIVPAYGAPTVDSISIKTPAAKTEYKVGESLDVTGLTITVRYSDQSEQDIPVTAEMVTGFDSAQAAESQTLTITYQGMTTTYTVKIVPSEQPPELKYQVTVAGSHAVESGAGAYEAGSTVTVHAGSYAGHVFTGWAASGVTLADPSQADISFVMPENDVSLTASWQADSTEPPTPGHTHAWKAEWETSQTHHWHSCVIPGCPITEDSQKSGYAAHTPGGWIVDQAATSTQSGSRHRTCSVCGYVTERETIPATGGGSSGGGSWGGGSSGSSGSGGGSSSSSKPTIEKHPDGTTTETVTDKATGTVTETTKRPDGTQTVVETQKDGTVTTTETTADGTVKTVVRPDGTSAVTIQRPNGITAELAIEAGGQTAVDVQIPRQLANDARQKGETIPLPIPEASIETNYTHAPSITVNTSGDQPVRVEIPVKDPVPGAVAILVRPDGTEEVLRNSVVTETSLVLTVLDGAVIKLVDNSKYFSDTGDHWAHDAIDFVSARELFSGQTPELFAPDAPMTRAMLVTVLARLDGVDTSGGAVWYEKGMAWAVAQGISDGSNLDRQITREQLVTMLHRYAGSPSASIRELSFGDSGAVSGYAREAMWWAVENGILNGYSGNTLAPGGEATRAQVSAILMRYIRSCIHNH